MQYLQVVLISAVSLVVLFLLTRLMGKIQIAQLNIFDYIIGISIGSIAAEMSTEQTQLLSYVLAMAVYALAAVGISILTNRSVKLRAAVAADAEWRDLQGESEKSKDGSQRIYDVLPLGRIF